MSASPTPSGHERPELERRLVALGRQLQRFGRTPRRGAGGEWFFSPSAPAGLLRSFIVLADELGVDRYEVLEPQPVDAGGPMHMTGRSR